MSDAATLDPHLAAQAGRDRPILIAGPTASGKSAVALALAERSGGVIVNADAMQVFANWRILTARPTPRDEERAPHRLYGHVAGDASYSVGHWLRDVAPLLGGVRPIIVGGTGLNLTALTQGLAEIPPIPAAVRAAADARRAECGIAGLLGDLDGRTAERLDRANPARVQRAWEVLRATGRGLADWQDDTPPPMLDPADAILVVIDPPRDVLAQRIARRFVRMLEAGVLDEARANLAGWSPAHPSSRAIGAPEIVAHLRGELTLDQAREATIVATRQYAKRQRTWLRKRMRDWHRLAWPPA